MAYKSFSLLPVLMLLSSFLPQQPYAWHLDEVVYYSIGPEAYAFHIKKECVRIRECLEEGHVRSCTRQEAIEKRHRQPCGTCLRKEHTYWKKNGWLKR